MSRKTPTSSARSLSPSDESRFVPHSSVVEPASVMEEHFAAASEQLEKADGDEVQGGEESGVNETEAASKATKETENERVQVADDEKSGIVGATICFTPDPSPCSSPNLGKVGGVESNPDSLNSSGNIIGNVNGAASGNMEGSAMHVASSLDGRSTTEYEILGSISSNGTMEVEDLTSGGEEDESANQKKKEPKSEGNLDEVGNEVASTLSPCSTLPSLNDTPFKMFKTPQTNAAETPYFPEEDRQLASAEASTNPKQQSLSGGSEENLPTLHNMPVDTPLKTPNTSLLDEKKSSPVLNEDERENAEEAVHSDPCFRIALNLDLEREDTSEDKDSKDSDSRSTSSGEGPLTPFKNLHKYWAGQPSFTHMTKSAVGRILCADCPTGVHLDAKEEAKANIPEEAAVNEVDKGRTWFKSPLDPGTSGEKPFSFEKSMQPSGTHVDELGGHVDGHGSTGQITPKPNTPLVKVKDVLSGLAGMLISFIISGSILIGAILFRQISSVFCMMKRMFWRILLQKVLGGMITQDIIQVDKTTHNKLNKAAVSSEDPVEHAGTNLSKLFLDEATEEMRKSALGEASDRQMEAEDPKDGGNDHNLTALDPTCLLKRISDDVTAGVIAKCKKILSSLKAINIRYAIMLCVLTSTILVWNCMLHHDIKEVQVSSIDVQEKPLVVQSHKEDDLRCISIHSKSFDQIPVWEIDLSPTSESFEEEPVVVQRFEKDDLRCFSTHSTSLDEIPLWEFNLCPARFESFEEEFEARSSLWLFAFVILSIVISLFCALILKSKIHFPFTKSKSPPKNLTGIWTEEEHQQFMEGYNIHGNRWKLVSAYVPTRTDTQVTTHGRYWLKIRSPATMKKARKAASSPVILSPPKKKKPETPGSVSSTNSTPRKSNKVKLTPIKGILIEKDNNQALKNVTPHSAGRTRRMKMKAAEGSKSDPGKRRVRIQAL